MTVRNALRLVMLMLLSLALLGWKPAAPLNVARQKHTATLLDDGRVLVVGGAIGGNTLASAEIYDPVKGAWTSTATPIYAHAGHTATLLTGGRVLVAGGTGDTTDPWKTQANAEIYTPDDNTWTPAAPMTMPRLGHTATLVAGGVLVAGGSGESTLADAEIYNPDDNTWIPVSPMNHARESHTATLLDGGWVLVAGGVTSEPIDSAEIRNPTTGHWTLTGSLKEGRWLHTATLLPKSGKVLVAGGSHTGLQPTASVEIYDPEDGTWTLAQPMKDPRSSHAATVLMSGWVLVAGSGDATTAARSELYDPEGYSWTDAGLMAEGRSHHTLTLFADGRVLAAGGKQGNTLAISDVEIYSPLASLWTPAAPTTIARVAHSATLLQDGQVLVAGGEEAGPTATAELYHATKDTWTAAAPLTVWRSGHTATLLPDGRVLAAGGFGNKVGIEPLSLASAEVYLPEKQGDTWMLVGSMAAARTGHTATLISKGRVLVAGGRDHESTGKSVRAAEVFDSMTNQWTPTGAMATARSGHTATTLDDGQVLVAGGSEESLSGVAVNTAEIYDPTHGVWRSVESLAQPRHVHAAALLDDGSGRVLVVGGVFTDPNPVVLSTAEIYDPRTGRWTAAASMSRERYAHTATSLQDGSGRVLVAGGRASGNTAQSSAEIYDPRTDLWSPAGDMFAVRAGHRATMLASNRGVLMTGGRGTSFDLLNSAEVFHLLVNGASCGHASSCESGFCVDGVCCDTACDDGLCDACSVTAGGPANGTCTALHPECTVFTCDPEIGACRTECTSIDDCAGDLVCVPDGRCVAASTPRDLSDCSLGAPAREGMVEGLVTALAALALARRRARCSKRRVSGSLPRA